MKNEIAAALLQTYGKKNAPDVQPGETVRVHQKIKEGEKERVQVYEGLVIAVKHGRGLDGTFTVRKIAAGGIGVERTFPLHSPNIVKVERTKAAQVSRAKLYYMRGRLGKAARFKHEDRDAKFVWEEPVAVPEDETVAVPEGDEQEVAPEVAPVELDEVEAEVGSITEVSVDAESNIIEKPMPSDSDDVETVTADRAEVGEPIENVEEDVAAEGATEASAEQEEK
jgi:large subunit ribosomal protein L19